MVDACSNDDEQIKNQALYYLGKLLDEFSTSNYSLRIGYEAISDNIDNGRRTLREAKAYYGQNKKD